MALPHLRQGSGEPLVLLHATGMARRSWSPVLAGLAAQRDVIAPDLPGFGEAPELAGDPSPRALAHSVAALLDDLGIPDAHAAGCSLGGWVSLELARLGRARSVTALSPSGFWNEREAAFCRRSLAATRAIATVIRPVAPIVLGSAVGRTVAGYQTMQHPWRMPAEDFQAAFAVVADSPGHRAASIAQTARRFEAPGEIDVPVTIAWAQHDRLLIPRQADRARRAFPAGRHLTLEGCGHVPFYDDPEQVARVLLEGSAPAGGG